MPLHRRVVIHFLEEHGGIGLILVFLSILSCGLTYLLFKSSKLIGIMDIPNHRSLHQTPKPRTGGLAIFVAITLGLILLRDFIDDKILSIFPYALFVIGIAFIDDVISISALLRLILQLVVAIVIVSNGLMFNAFVLPGVDITLPAYLGSIISVFFIVWMVNLYNFMDGMDGFAAGMAVIGFATFALLGFLRGDIGFVLLNLIIVGASIGFLIFNLPPSKIFLGDVGSTLFGMLVAIITLWADVKGIFPAWIGIIVFLPFILDASVTLAKRIIQGEAVWKAHRSHYYQRLVLSGLGHKKTLLMEYIGMLACATLSIILFVLDDSVMQIKILVFFTLMVIALLLYIDKKVSLKK